MKKNINYMKYILRLEPYIYTSHFNNNILFYNTLNAEFIYHEINPEEDFICKENIVSIESDNLSNSLCKKLIQKNMAIIVKNKKIFSVDIYKKILNEYDSLVSDDNITKSNRINDQLIKVTLCLYDNSFLSTYPLSISKQHDIFSYIPTQGKPTYNCKLILKLLQNRKYRNIKEITIAISHLTNDLHELIVKLSKLYHINIYIPFHNYIQYPLFDLKDCSIKTNLILKKEDDTSKLDLYMNNCKFHIYIGNEDDFRFYDILKSKIYSLSPHVYIEKRNEFVSKLISYELSSVLNPALSLKNVIRNSRINELFWGEIVIHPNGDILSSALTKTFNLYNNSIDEILCKLSQDKESWLLTRNLFAPCSKCLYRFLCPPVSKIELFSGKTFCIDNCSIM